MDSSESGSSRKRQKTSDAEKELDCSNASRGVWLVKVPKYISSLWEKASPLCEAGRLRISRTGPKTDIKFSLSDEMLKSSDGKLKTDIPKDHRFVITNIAHQTLAIFGSENGDAGGSSDANGKLFLGGHVLQKCECKPLADQRYMNLKRESILKASQPERQVKQLMKAVTSYKPVSDHKHNIEYEQKKKAEGRKARDDKDKVMDMLFAAFEKHQYYNIKDLEKITRQPIEKEEQHTEYAVQYQKAENKLQQLQLETEKPYLKEILKEICNYNAKNPHKSMWELKPEYRHYKASDGAE